MRRRTGPRAWVTEEAPRTVLIGGGRALIAEAAAYPGLIVLAQIENQHAPVRAQDAHGFRERLFRVGGVMQRL